MRTFAPRAVLMMVLGALLLGSAPGCNAVDDRYWGFPVSSAIYRGMKRGSGAGSDSSSSGNLHIPTGPHGLQAVACIVGGVVACILAADLLALVVTLPHDLCVGRPCRPDRKSYYHGTAPEHRR